MTIINMPAVVNVEWAKQEIERIDKKTCNKDLVFYVMRADGDIDWVDLSELPTRNHLKVLWSRVKNNSIVASISGVLYKMKVSNNGVIEGRTKIRVSYEDKELVLNTTQLMKVGITILVKEKVYNKPKLSEIPYIKPYITNEKDLEITGGSGKKIHCQCPDCGESKYVIVQNLYREGFRCSCNDKRMSFGEKVVTAYLNTLYKEYKREFVFNNLKNRRFDFYLPKENKVIEVHGLQHYKKDKHFNNTNFDSYYKTKESDMIKKQYCEDNNIEYTVIDASRSFFIPIISQLTSSEKVKEEVFNEFRRLNNNDRNEEIINLSLKELSLSEIVEITGISRSIIKRVRKNNNLQGSFIMNNRGEASFKKVKCINTGEKFESIKEAKNHYNLSDGVKIGMVCQGKRKSAGTLNGTPLQWEYID